MKDARRFLEDTHAAQEEAVRREREREFERRHKVWRSMRLAQAFQNDPNAYVNQNTMQLVSMADALSSQIRRFGLEGFEVSDLNALYERMQKKYWGKKNRVFQGPNTIKKEGLLSHSISNLRNAMKSVDYESHPDPSLGAHIYPGTISFGHYQQFV